MHRQCVPTPFPSPCKEGVYVGKIVRVVTVAPVRHVDWILWLIFRVFMGWFLGVLIKFYLLISRVANHNYTDGEDDCWDSGCIGTVFSSMGAADNAWTPRLLYTRCRPQRGTISWGGELGSVQFMAEQFLLHSGGSHTIDSGHGFLWALQLQFSSLWIIVTTMFRFHAGECACNCGSLMFSIWLRSVDAACLMHIIIARSSLIPRPF